MKNLMFKISLLIAGFFAAAAVADAQQIKGVVTDSNGDPLVGVSVFVDGTTLGVSTDVDGQYTIDIPDARGKTLVFSCIGMATKEIIIGQNTNIDITLEDDTNFLDETVVIGYATVRRRDLLGSVTSVSSDAIAAVPVTTVGEALTGKMAGVQVTTTEGDPDAEIKIRVRGTGSITQDSSPLYIVDGFPVESISDIAASDIQSIDVLKDAFSTAIYGSRGANGVVLVTTKSGGAGKVSVSYDAYYGLKTMANKKAIQPMDPYEFVRSQYELASLRDAVNENYIDVFGQFQDMDLYQNMQGNDWIQQVFGRTGETFNHNLTVSGRSDKVSWTASYNHINDKAIMLGSDYHRDNLRFKTRYKPIKQLTFDLNMRYSYTKIMGSGSNSMNDTGTTSGNGRLKHAVQYTPIPLDVAASGADMEENYGDNAPPIQSVADNDNRRIRQSWNTNASVTWHIIDNLDLKVEGGLETYSQTNDRFYGITTYYVANNVSEGYENQPAAIYTALDRKTIRNTNTLTYNFKDVIKDDRHKVDLLVGEEMIITKESQFSSTVDGFPDNFTSEQAWSMMSVGHAVTSNNRYYPDDRLLSFFGRINYDFDERYSIAATLRADGSSRFAKDKQWGVFPSAAASWTISNESWMKGAAGWLDNLKLRYSFGTAGNNNIPQNVTSLMFESYDTGDRLSNGTVIFRPVTDGGDIIMANEDLSWETTYSHNLGLDFSFFKSRINGSIEVYHNTTEDLLIQFPTAGSGYAFQYKNMGSVLNKGAELSFNLVLVEKKNFGLTFSGNISINHNEVLSIGNLPSITASSRWSSTGIGSDYIVQQGQPLGNMYGFEVEGMYTLDDFTYNEQKGTWEPNPGVADAASRLGTEGFRPGGMKIKDRNNNGTIDEGDKTVIGNALPIGTGGFSLSGTLYGIDFSANFNYVFGNDVYNANKIEFTSTASNYRRNLLNTMDTEKRWTNIDWSTGELVTDATRLAQMNEGVTMWAPFTQQRTFTDWAVEDGSFLRLQSATIGYTLPQKLTLKAKIQRLRFYVTGTNLFCLTKYSGYDPEVDTRRATPLTPGVDYSAYPKSIGFVAGVNITF